MNQVGPLGLSSKKQIYVGKNRFLLSFALKWCSILKHQHGKWFSCLTGLWPKLDSILGVLQRNFFWTFTPGYSLLCRIFEEILMFFEINIAANRKIKKEKYTLLQTIVTATKIIFLHMWICVHLCMSPMHTYMGFPGGASGQESASLAQGRSPGVGNGNPFQYSCLENPMDRGAWRVTVHGVLMSWAWLNTHAHEKTNRN